MKIIDRIALNHALRIIADFILQLIKMFQKEETKPEDEVAPKPKPKRILPWRK